MSDLEPVGSGLDGLLRRLGIPSPDDAARIVDEWARLSGEPWASRSRPGGLRDGELVVEADDPAVATLLRYRGSDLADRLNDALGVRAVRSVRVTVARNRRGRS